MGESCDFVHLVSARLGRWKGSEVLGLTFFSRAYLVREPALLSYSSSRKPLIACVGRGVL